MARNAAHLMPTIPASSSRPLKARLHAAASQQSIMGVSILDMGQHMLPKVPGSHLIIQVLVPGLEERARATAPLASVAMSPGKACSRPADSSMSLLWLHGMWSCRFELPPTLCCHLLHSLAVTP